MKCRTTRSTAKRLCLFLPALGALSAGQARADECVDGLVQQVFVHHAAGATPASKMAMQAWLCEGDSDAFLSQQATLPTSPSDLAAWNALLGAIDGDTEISSTPVGSGANVAQFRTDNCADPVPGYLIHALGRVATPAEFESWHACDAAATWLANDGSDFFDLDLSCAGQQTASGTLQLSVRGFDRVHSSAVSPLRNFVVGATNLTQISGSTAIQSGHSGLFEFTVNDPSLESSVTLRASAATSFNEDVHYFCSLDVNEFPSTSRPYVLPPEAECAFDANRPGTTSCAGGGTLELKCEDGAWVDSDVCVPPAWSDNNWQIQFRQTLAFSEETSAGNTFWSSNNRLTFPGTNPPVVADVYMEERPCSQFEPKLSDARGRDFTTTAGQPLRALVTSSTRTSSAYFFIRRPEDATKCLALQFAPNMKVTIDLDAQTGIGKTLLDIGKSMKSLSTRPMPSPRPGPSIPPRRT